MADNGEPFDDTVVSVRLAVVGGGGVGKSALTIQFMESKFVDEYDPTIEEIYRRQLTVDNSVYMLDILDTAGQEEYKALREAYLGERDAFLLVYSITSSKSYEQVSEWHRDILRVKGEDAFVPIVLVGNKLDLAETQRKVSTSEAELLCQELKVPLFEASAKTRHNVIEAISELCRLERKRKTDSGLLKFGNASSAKGKKKGGEKKKGGLCTLL